MSSEPPPEQLHDFTRRVQESREGDSAATDDILRILYPQLRNMARKQMRRLPVHASVQPTMVVHEAIMRLLRGQWLSGRDRRHLLALAGRAMHDVLVDAARRRSAAKRGGNRRHVDFPLSDVAEEPLATDWLELHDVLLQLANVDHLAAQVVELRYFAGMTTAEAAEALGVSSATVDRRWAFARAWLHKRLDESRN